jgi:hypothetical protein
MKLWDKYNWSWFDVALAVCAVVAIALAL